MRKNLLLKLINEAEKAEILNFILTGGEPLLYPSFSTVLKELHDRNITTKIATNGFFLDKRNVDLLGRYEVSSVQISLDTLKPSKFYELTSAPLHAFEKVLHGIDAVLNAGIFHVVVAAVVTKLNRESLSDLMDFCHEKGVDTLTLYKPIPLKTGSYNTSIYLDEHEYQKLLHELISRFVRYKSHWLVEMGLPWDKYTDLAKFWDRKIDINYVGCIGGKFSLNVTVDGYVTPCVCLDFPEFYCGKVEESISLENFWKSEILAYFRGAKEIDVCNKCRYMNDCLAGCRAISFAYFHKVDARNPTCPVGMKE
jgi:radical SAM protein with 4Fe4S-binding SPASM domain